MALSRLRWAGISTKTIANTLAHSYLSPVLTAHPTEVQRKSILDAERAIARLLTAARRDQDARRRRRPAQGHADPARTGRQRGPAARPRAATVADAPGAQQQADRGRRDRQRAELLRAHLPARDPGHLRRAGARTGPAAPAQLPAHGPLDRRRPRRQPQCGRAHHGHGPGPPGRRGPAPLPDRSAPAGRRTVAVRPAGGLQPRDAQAGRALARHQRAPQGRTLPPRPDRHLRPPGRHPAGADRRRGRAPRGGAAEPLRQRRRIPGRPADHRRLAERTPRRRPGPAAPASADPRGGGVRLSPRHAGLAPELGQARGSGGRTAGHGAHRVALRQARRNGQAQPAAAPAGRCPAAARGGRQLQPRTRKASWRSSRPPA